jgi:hypothetical protein
VVPWGLLQARRLAPWSAEVRVVRLEKLPSIANN